MYLATASDKGTIVRIFEVATGTKLYQFRRGTYPTKIYSLRFSADDKYVLATSSSLTVHIFRLGEEEALETKHKKKIPAVATILEEETEGSQSNEQTKSIKRNSEEFEDIRDDGDDSDVDDEDGDIDDESLEVIPAKQRKPRKARQIHTPVSTLKMFKAIHQRQNL